MTAYTDIASVESYYMNLDITSGANAVVTNDEINAWIEQKGAIIDQKLSKVYEVPFTNATDLLIMKQLNDAMVVCDLDRRLRENDEQGKFNFKRNKCKEAEKLFDDILTGNLPLNAPKVGTATAKSPNDFNDVDSEGNTVEPSFKIADANPDNWA